MMTGCGTGSIDTTWKGDSELYSKEFNEERVEKCATGEWFWLCSMEQLGWINPAYKRSTCFGILSISPYYLNDEFYKGGSIHYSYPC